jgi:hypothetical protein
MITSFRLPAIASGLCLLAGALVWSVHSYAALPPQYDRWNEFAAVVGDSAIPRQLGVHNLAERIERMGDGSYRVHGGKCYVAVRLARTAPRGPQGQPILGSATVSIAGISAPYCS